MSTNTTWDDPTCAREYRYLVSRGRAEEFLAKVAPYVAREVYHVDRPIAYTRTTYLDTDSLAYAFSAGRGAAERLRVREYAAAAPGEPPRLTGVCFLELKSTRANRRRKLRLAGRPGDIARLVASRGAARAPFKAPFVGELVERLRVPTLAPRVATWYRRESLIGLRESVRITLDEGVRFIEPATPGRAGEVVGDARTFGRARQRVLEVKLTGPAPAWLTAAAVGLHETDTFSKFGWAVAALRRGVRDSHSQTAPLEIPVTEIRRRTA